MDNFVKNFLADLFFLSTSDLILEIFAYKLKFIYWNQDLKKHLFDCVEFWYGGACLHRAVEYSQSWRSRTRLFMQDNDSL